jgi:serine/threonine protein kinase
MICICFTPIEGTISAAEEHRVLIEVERMQIIEKIESGDIEKHKHVRVPHPYFQYDSGKIQCYGMELIKGLNLHEAIQGEWFDEEQKTKVREAIGHIPLEEIRKEFEIFIENMHQFCLHRDIKPANIMISEEGMFYLIDFGQSELVTNMHGKNPEQIRAEMQRIVHMAIIVIFGLVGFGVLVNAHESQKAKNLQAKRVQNANRIQ